MLARSANHRLTKLRYAFACVSLLVAGVAHAASAVPAEQALATSAASTCSAWPRWDDFKRDFLSHDGRVVDQGSADDRTVSEGQSYGLFFALVADDRPSFDAILDWTQANLAAGDLVGHLPAWLWGRKADGSWGVLDANSASDSDLWIAYSLLQAGRIWHERRYTALGMLLARRVLQEETAVLPGLGHTLLPAKVGFHPRPDTWRLNPSYVPLQVLEGLAQALPDQPEWPQLIMTSTRLLLESAPHGYAPDWVEYRTSTTAGTAATTSTAAASATAASGFLTDRSSAGTGSYNAIRVYLWAGMLASASPARKPLLQVYRPMADYVAVHGYPPEKIDTATGAASHEGPAGFSAALLPFLDALDQTALADQQAAREQSVERHTPSGYYSQVLTLFGDGWRAGRFRFAVDGSVTPAWSAPCAPPAP